MNIFHEDLNFNFNSDHNPPRPKLLLRFALLYPELQPLEKVRVVIQILGGILILGVIRI